MNMAKTTFSFMAAALLATSSTLALAQTCNPHIPLTNPDSRYTYNAAGDEVTDSVTGLIWKRCAEGMSWSGGTCTGAPSAFNWEAALAHAATQTGWRLPYIKELETLVEVACYDMAINETAFPNTPIIAWSASRYEPVPGSAWYVNFGDGGRDWFNKFLGSVMVRLVRGQ
jgi:hypothetical protein